MFRSQDGKITAAVVKSLGETAFPTADFSILNVPLDQAAAASMFTNLANMPCPRHTALVFARYPRGSKIEAIKNLSQHDPLNFLDMVHLWYEKPSTSSNVGFLPVAEDGYLFYKGDAPNVKNTAWFADKKPNATNFWGVSPAEYEGRAATHFRRFSWEIALLLYTMCEPIQSKRMIYGLDEDHEHVLKFSKTYGVQVHFLVSSEELAKNIISKYEIV